MAGDTAASVVELSQAVIPGPFLGPKQAAGLDPALERRAASPAMPGVSGPSVSGMMDF